MQLRFGKKASGEIKVHLGAVELGTIEEHTIATDVGPVECWKFTATEAAKETFHGPAIQCRKLKSVKLEIERAIHARLVGGTF